MTYGIRNSFPKFSNQLVRVQLVEHEEKAVICNSYYNGQKIEKAYFSAVLLNVQ